jgi:hypothetical protein
LRYFRCSTTSPVFRTFRRIDRTAIGDGHLQDSMDAGDCYERAAQAERKVQQCA